MSLSDPISDMLTRIRNAQVRKHGKVSCRHSRVNEDILKVLQNKGFIESFDTKEIRAGISDLVVTLKYFNGEPTIKSLKRVSKPGCRIYKSAQELKPVFNGLGYAVMSTSKGVITDDEARSQKVGGEVLFEIY
ncbi:MAG: 30S ribosomal protein S8 [Rickettsiales bacterium]|nr:30S ribosomal protein S8 [Rickettsiales bacterium]|tara:strand:- start:10334 stop:10732 length:399 start_codon:yes stop_codon:yes gene_type:complete